MSEFYSEDLLGMIEGFIAIIVFALISFYLLNYLSQNDQLANIVVSIFESLKR